MCIRFLLTSAADRQRARDWSHLFIEVSVEKLPDLLDRVNSSVRVDVDAQRPKRLTDDAEDVVVVRLQWLRCDDHRESLRSRRVRKTLHAVFISKGLSA